VDLPEDGLTPRLYFREVPDAVWKDGRGVRWDHREVEELLDVAEACLREKAADLHLEALIKRKERAVGLIPLLPPLKGPSDYLHAPASHPHVTTAAATVAATAGATPAAPAGVAAAASASTSASSTAEAIEDYEAHIHALDAATLSYFGRGGKVPYELLEEIALETQARIAAAGISIPHCAFNGGSDVFIDVGSKALGIRALQARTGATASETVHIGDRFTKTGNDYRARDVANTLWVSSPSETEFLLSLLIRGKRQALLVKRQQAASDAAALCSADGAAGSVASAPPVTQGKVNILPMRSSILSPTNVMRSLSTAAGTVSTPPSPQKVTEKAGSGIAAAYASGANSGAYSTQDVSIAGATPGSMSFAAMLETGGYDGGRR
jgi:hypothetical protein